MKNMATSGWSLIFDNNLIPKQIDFCRFESKSFISNIKNDILASSDDET